MNDSLQQSMRYDLRQHGQLAIAVISDTHGQLDRNVAAVVADSDVVMHAGDIMGASVLDQLTPRLGIVIAVRGNNDVAYTWSSDGQSRLSEIPESVTVACAGGDIAMQHGHRLARIHFDHFPLAYQYPDARLVIYGHTHVQRLDDDSRPWLLNPGAAGLTRNQGGASCYQLHVDADQWQVQPFKFCAARRAG